MCIHQHSKLPGSLSGHAHTLAMPCTLDYMYGRSVTPYFSNQLQQMPQHLHSVELLLLTHLRMVEDQKYCTGYFCTDQCIDKDREVAFFTAGAEPPWLPHLQVSQPCSDPFRRDKMDSMMSIKCHDSASHLNKLICDVDFSCRKKECNVPMIRHLDATICLTKHNPSPSKAMFFFRRC